MEPKDRDHLALKVMRLTRPTLYVTFPFTCDSRDLAGDLLTNMTRDDIASVENVDDLSVGNLLMLPQSFGNIYLGETFSSYISVHNESDQVVKDVSMKADLQTSSHRIPLASHSSNITAAQLLPDQSMDGVIHHEVKDIGAHILVCAINYATSEGEKMFFRKFFKFQVMKPLDVKTKFYNAEDHLSDEVYLEAQVQNITSAPVCLEQVSLEPSSYFQATQLNTIEIENRTEPVFGKINCLHPMDSRQFLFCLCPKAEAKVNPKTLKEVTNIGKLDIVWRTNMGDRGRLQTSQLQRMAPGYGDIRLDVKEIPNIVDLEKPFYLLCKVINCCERSIDLQLTLNKTANPGLRWIGVSGRPLGTLSPDATLDLRLQLVPIRQGLQTISGICLTDTFLKRTYDYDDVAQVFVQDTSQS